MLPQEEQCPVEESLLGELYRASPQGLHTLVETIPATVRAMLAVYCYRRSHLSDLGLAIASTCDRRDLRAVGGELGSVVFAQSRTAPATIPEKRRKITLSSGSPISYLIAQDLI
jgi:hypothetical protein